MKNIRFTATEASEMSKQNKILSLPSEDLDKYKIIISNVIELASKGDRYWIIPKEDKVFSCFTPKINQILEADGYSITHDYAGEEYDYEYFGIIMKW